MSKRRTRENPLYLTATIAATTSGTALLDNGGQTGYFRIPHAINSSVEWEITGANATGFDLKVQMLGSDGTTWIDARDGDTAAGTAKFALATAEATLARGFTTLDTPFTRNAMRLVADNNNANEITIECWVHFSEDLDRR